MFYYDEPYKENCCPSCDYKEENKRNVADFMQGIIDQLYGKERFNSMALEGYLEEVAFYFGLKVPQETLKIKGTQPPAPLTDSILSQWKDLNNKYLKSLGQ